MARIGIVIPAFNSERFLSATLKGVMDQTFTDWNCVVVDDGSVDQTAEIVAQVCREDPRFKLVRQDNSGIARARNRGYQEIDSNADYVIFLDHDDIWEAEALHTLFTVLDAHPNAVGAHGLARYIDQDGVPISPETIMQAHRSKSALSVAPPDLEDWQRNRMKYADGDIVPAPLDQPTDFSHLIHECRTVTPGTVLIRRSALRESYPFDPALVPLDAWDLWIRISRFGDILFVNQRVLNYRFHAGNASKSYQGRMDGILNALYRKTFLSSENSDEHRQILAQWRQRHMRIQLRGFAGGFVRGVVSLLKGDINKARFRLRLSRRYLSEYSYWVSHKK